MLVSSVMKIRASTTKKKFYQANNVRSQPSTWSIIPIIAIIAIIDPLGQQTNNTNLQTELKYRREYKTLHPGLPRLAA